MGLTDTITTKAGPLAVWQWGVLGGAALLVVALLKRKGGGVTPLTVVPQLDFTGKTPPAGLTGGILDELTHFICMLPNAPDQLGLSLPDGSNLTLMNGIPTFGSAAAWQQNQDGSTSAVSTWNPCKPKEVAPENPPTGGGGGPTGGQWFPSGPGWQWIKPYPGGIGHPESIPSGYDPNAPMGFEPWLNWSANGPTSIAHTNPDGTISI